MKKKVKIIKCDYSDYWYYNKIGQVVDVYANSHHKYYWLVWSDNNESKLLIKKEDTIIFDREKKINKILNNIKNKYERTYLTTI